MSTPNTPTSTTPTSLTPRTPPKYERLLPQSATQRRSTLAKWQVYRVTIIILVFLATCLLWLVGSQPTGPKTASLHALTFMAIWATGCGVAILIAAMLERHVLSAPPWAQPIVRILCFAISVGWVVAAILSLRAGYEVIDYLVKL